MSRPARRIYFGSSAADKAEQRRARAMSKLFDLDVVYLRGFVSARLPERTTILLKQQGNIRLGAFRRLLGQVQAISVLRRMTAQTPEAVIIVKNIDNLISLFAALGLRGRKGITIVYELCDIHGAFCGRLGRPLRAVERYLVWKFVDYVMTTSMGFQSFWHFPPEKILLWENFYAGIEDLPAHRNAVSQNPVNASRIVYHGRLRDQRSLEILSKMTNFEVALYGQMEDVSAVDNRQPTRFDYPEDIDELLHERCLVWCVTGKSTNERLLLSNRLYDALAFQCIPVVSIGSYQECYCKEHGAEFVSINPRDAVSKIEADIASQLQSAQWDFDISKWLVHRDYVPNQLRQL
jgi:hypothetical protein